MPSRQLLWTGPGERPSVGFRQSSRRTHERGCQAPHHQPRERGLRMTMPAASRLWLGLAGLSGAAGVALSAAAAHETLSDARLVATSGEFLLLHAPALIAAAWLADRRGGASPSIAGLAFFLGILLFCGTLALRGMGVSAPD